MRPRGFTMVELITVMAVVAIVATMAVPMMFNMIENARLSATANDVIEALTLARSEAVKRNEVVRVVPTDGTNWQKGWVVRRADNSVVQQFEDPPEAFTFASTVSVTEIPFGPNGARSTGASALELSVCAGSGKGRKISVSITGSTKVEKVDAGCT